MIMHYNKYLFMKEIHKQYIFKYSHQLGRPVMGHGKTKLEVLKYYRERGITEGVIVAFIEKVIYDLQERIYNTRCYYSELYSNAVYPTVMAVVC